MGLALHVRLVRHTECVRVYRQHAVVDVAVDGRRWQEHFACMRCVGGNEQWPVDLNGRVGPTRPRHPCQTLDGAMGQRVPVVIDGNKAAASPLCLCTPTQSRYRPLGSQA